MDALLGDVDGLAPQPTLALVKSDDLLLARWRGDRDVLDYVLDRAPFDRHRLAAARRFQRLFLEVGLLHQPMREPAQEVSVGPAALIAARPEPSMVREQERDAALAALADDEKRLVFRALHQHF